MPLFSYCCWFVTVLWLVGCIVCCSMCSVLRALVEWRDVFSPNNRLHCGSKCTGQYYSTYTFALVHVHSCIDSCIDWQLQQLYMLYLLSTNFWKHFVVFNISQELRRCRIIFIIVASVFILLMRLWLPLFLGDKSILYAVLRHRQKVIVYRCFGLQYTMKPGEAHDS